jgi:hypothetical protein
MNDYGETDSQVVRLTENNIKLQKFDEDSIYYINKKERLDTNHE